MSTGRSIQKTTEQADYESLRNKLLDRGYSLRSFALAFGYKVPTVYDAARGSRAGKTTRTIRRHLRKVANS